MSAVPARQTRESDHLPPVSLCETRDVLTRILASHPSKRLNLREPHPEEPMRTSTFAIALVGQLLLPASGAGAQDYRGRVQGSVRDSTQGALPGATVTMVNDATGV